MKCSACGKRMRQISRHTFKGWKHGVPGERLSYCCKHCGCKKNLLVIDEQDFQKLKEMFQEYRNREVELICEMNSLRSGIGKNRVLRDGDNLEKELHRFLKELRRV